MVRNIRNTLSAAVRQAVRWKKQSGVGENPVRAELVDPPEAHHEERAALSRAEIREFPAWARRSRRAFDTLRKRLGLPDLKLHGLRHSATSLYLALGVPAHVVRVIMGHADRSTTTCVSAHVHDEDKR